MPDLLLIVAVALAGAALFVLGGVRLWLRHDIHGVIFGEQLVKLVRADKRELALRLAGVVPETPCGALAIAALSHRHPARDPHAMVPADYRSATVERSFQERVHEWLAGERAACMKRVTRATQLAVTGSAVLLGAAVLAGSRSVLSPMQVLIAAMIAALLGASAIFKRSKIGHDVVALSLALEPLVLAETEEPMSDKR